MSDVGIKTTRIWHPDDFKGTPYEARSQLFTTMEVGDEVLMWATTPIEYASVRGAAYSFARGRRMKFRAKRKSPQIIRIWREA